MAADRHRIRYTFWLDMKKGDEETLADHIEMLKNKRSFAKAIRDGIRLILDLREGRVDVLLELFPWVEAKLQIAPPAPSGNDNLMKEIDVLKQLILAKPADAYQMAPMGEGTAKVHPSLSVIRTNRPRVAKLPPVTPQPVVEVDTSEAFLNAF